MTPSPCKTMSSKVYLQLCLRKTYNTQKFFFLSVAVIVVLQILILAHQVPKLAAHSVGKKKLAAAGKQVRTLGKRICVDKPILLIGVRHYRWLKGLNLLFNYFT